MRIRNLTFLCETTEEVSIAYALVGERATTTCENGYLVGRTSDEWRSFRVQLQPRAQPAEERTVLFQAFFGNEGSENFAQEVLARLLEAAYPGSWEGEFDGAVGETPCGGRLPIGWTTGKSLDELVDLAIRAKSIDMRVRRFEITGIYR